ncbi:MAG: hypothetical protein CYPHOPRED_005590 [Cyphobasidiales sp. Tagirdzhanova-0007]|nr:MAG: hypothetical protein CYPHOPRED_005590 [Cyphobasidiales sp. Tagirdzhanova-0007]
MHSAAATWFAVYSTVLVAGQTGDVVMSFSDLERGVGQRGHQRGRGETSHDEVALLDGGDDRRFAALADRIALQIFRVNSNVKGIESLVKQLGGRNDSPELRTMLSNLNEATRELVKSSTEDVKELAGYNLSGQASDDGPTRQRKLKQAKISRDFQSAILGYQSAAKTSVEKQRLYVDRAKAAIDQGDDQRAREALSPGNDNQQHQQQVQQTDLVPDSELEYQEQLIQEREGEIEEIERGVLELNEIFRDLGTIVTEQQSMLDNIESNVISIANDTQGASEELSSAHVYQRKAGRRMLCLLMIFILVLAIVLLAILS